MLLATRLILILMLLLGLSLASQAVKPDPLARAIQVDPAFAYYQDRSRESIVSEVKANGYKCIRLVVTNDADADAELVKACHAAGVAVWYLTFGNGVYGSGGLPAGSEGWRMRLRDKQPDQAAEGFVYLCLNNPAYRAWKKQQVVATLKRIPFDGFEMAEPFWPAFKGPESPYYGCLCSNCRTAFLKAHPEEHTIPNFTDDKHPDYYKTNTTLYNKWVDFRVQSVTAFQNDIINGPGGVRKSCPNVKVAIWGIADDVPNPVQAIREWEGVDCALVAKTIKPDVFVIQTDWPDWSNPKLQGNYALKYKPFVDAVRAVSKVPIQMQADIGSFENCRRGSDWIANCEAAARKAGIIGVFSYEYHLSRDIYEAPPKPVSAVGHQDAITLAFNKRLDPAAAKALSNYSLDFGHVLEASVDGNLVILKVKGRPTKVTVRGLSDDPSRRFFKKHPAVTMARESVLCIHYE